MAVPTYVTGQVLAASDCNNWFLPLVAYKTGVTTLSTTTLTNDPDLTLPVAASAVYEIRALIAYTNATGSSPFHWAFTLPSGASGNYGGTYNKPGPNLNTWYNNWTAAIDGAASDNVGHGMVLAGTLFTASTAGSLTLQWCCTNASAGSLAVGIGSNLIARRIG